MVVAAGEALSLCVLLAGTFVVVRYFMKGTLQSLLGRWLFFNAFLPLLDGRGHKVLDEHSG